MRSATVWARGTALPSVLHCGFILIFGFIQAGCPAEPADSPADPGPASPAKNEAPAAPPPPSPASAASAAEGPAAEGPAAGNSKSGDSAAARAPKPAEPAGPPLAFTVAEKPVVCRYELEEVRTETLGEQGVGGHRVDVQLTAEVVRKKGQKAFQVTFNVNHVQVEAKSAGYRTKLDSSRAADQRRVAGGADTLVFFDVVTYFALLGGPITASFNEHGALEGALKGAAEARERLSKFHPERPRRDPRQRALIELALSDRAILERLWPHAPEFPQRGLAVGAELPPAPTYRGYDDFPAIGRTVRRLSKAGGRILFELKSALAPPDAMPKLDVALAPQIPARKGPPSRKLLSVERSVLAELAAPDPCLVRAASQEELHVAWEGQKDEQDVNAEQVIRTVRILKKNR